MECPLARQQHANCPDRLEGNKGDGFSQAGEKCALLVVIVHKLLFVVSVKINHADLVA